MQSNLKIKARKIAKQTWAGPGKFGVFIVLCIIVIATFESLGLSNRERNLEIRSVPLVAVQLNLKTIEERIDQVNEEEVDSTTFLRMHALKDFEDSDRARADMILLGAVDQYVYENSTESESQNLISEEDLSYLHQNKNNVEQITNEEEIDLSFFDV